MLTMRRSTRRFLLLATPFLIIVILLLTPNPVSDIYDQYNVPAYIASSVTQYWREPQRASAIKGAKPGDKVIVMARLEEEDTSWVEEELADWQRAIYIVNPSEATLSDPEALKTPLNKGHESMAYLTYIIDNYNNLPSTITFLHSHRSGFLKAWHVDSPHHDNVQAMRDLQLDYVQKTGYVNLRCNWNPGCEIAHRENAHVTPEIWREIWTGTSTPPPLDDEPEDTSKNLEDDDDDDDDKSKVSNFISSLTSWRAKSEFRYPSHIGAACCAQFAVSRSQVRKRPVSDYVKLREWVERTGESDAKSGRVMEFLWHVIFGRDAVFCPDEKTCYCQVYGKCKKEDDDDD